MSGFNSCPNYERNANSSFYIILFVVCFCSVFSENAAIGFYVGYG